MAELSERMGGVVARQVLSRLTRKGLLLRVGRGRYRVVKRTVEEDPFPRVAPEATIHRALSGLTHYFGGPWALAHHTLTPDEPSAIDVFVRTRMGNRQIGGVSVRFHQRPDKCFDLGLEERDAAGERILVTSAERTLVEFLDQPRIFPGGAERIRDFDFRLNHVRRIDLVIDYAITFASAASCQRLGVLLERRHLAWKKLDELRDHVAAHARSIISLHPDRARRGRINPTWLVSENDTETFVTRRY